MEYLNNYSLNDVYQMMRARTIGLDEISYYISHVIPNMDANDDIRTFLATANTYVDQLISDSIVETAEPVSPSQVMTENEITPIQENNAIGDSVADRNEKMFEEQPEQEERVEEQPEIVTDDEYPFYENDNNSFEEARASMEETYRYCQNKGLTIDDISLSGKGGRGPYISFEINYESKQYLDHLMNELYQNTNGISMELMRNLSTKNEMFTIEIDPSSMSQEEFYSRVRDTFDRIYEIVESTRNDLDYESTMPDGLRNIKDHFNNDDPDIGEDFTIGYVRNDGKDTYYIIADNNQQAIEYAQSIGYDIKNSQGANIFEIDANNSLVDSKLDASSIDLSSDANILNIGENGVSDLDIYGSLEVNPKVDLITNFIETSNDPHIMCMLEIEIPNNNTSQRVVRLKNGLGNDDVIVFEDGKDFDEEILPKIVDTYASNNAIDSSNISFHHADNNNVLCSIDSENNTMMKIDGYSENEINQLINEVQSKVENENHEKNNVPQKTIGTYQTSNNNESAAFVSMSVLIIICLLFLLMISMVVFAW